MRSRLRYHIHEGELAWVIRMLSLAVKSWKVQQQKEQYKRAYILLKE
ncbi:MAG: hypothetical protein H2212_15985 [Ruminococcus sp.]|nr:hypothetical protein [Ruminococcus sp.]